MLCRGGKPCNRRMRRLFTLSTKCHARYAHSDVAAPATHACVQCYEPGTNFLHPCFVCITCATFTALGKSVGILFTLPPDLEFAHIVTLVCPCLFLRQALRRLPSPHLLTRNLREQSETQKLHILCSNCYLPSLRSNFPVNSCNTDQSTAQIYF